MSQTFENVKENSTEAPSADAKAPRYYATIFMKHYTELKITTSTNDSVVNICADQVIHPSQARTNFSHKDWLCKQVITNVCEAAAKALLIDGKSQPEKWVGREITCIFESGTTDPDTISTLVVDGKTYTFDVLYSLGDKTGNLKSGVIRLDTKHPYAPATKWFYDTFCKLVLGVEWKTLAAPCVHAILSVA